MQWRAIVVAVAVEKLIREVVAQQKACGVAGVHDIFDAHEYGAECGGFCGIKTWAEFSGCWVCRACDAKDLKVFRILAYEEVGNKLF